MMSQTPRKTPAKGKDRFQSTAKGCSCKRSECIKNYCDCYQSLVVCTQLCRCIGCRNTEERMAVEPHTSSRNSNALKRDRAAAKERTNIPKPLVSKGSMPVTLSTLKEPINIIRVAPDDFNVVPQEVSTEQLMPLEAKEKDELPTTSTKAKDMQSPEVEPPDDTDLSEPHNLFDPIINDAQLVCSLIQASEAEQLGVDPNQVGRLIITEFTNCFIEVCEKILNK